MQSDNTIVFLLLHCCAVLADHYGVTGPGNGIVQGQVAVRKGSGNGAGARSNCKSFNSVNGLITAVNAKPGDEGLKLPPSDGRYCDGVIEKFREGTSP
jgi:hypothetical protein